jgi:hypothetical protein
MDKALQSMPAAGPFDGTEELYVEQGGNSRHATANQLLGLALKSANNLSDLGNLAAALDNIGRDVDGTLAANSDLKWATQKAVVTYVAAQIAAALTGLLDLKGGTNCAANPNYPVASKGDAYYVTAAGKIGGAAGAAVDIGDVYFANADNAGGTQAAVGASWTILEHNLAGALLAANNLSDLANAATARDNLGCASKELTIETVAGAAYTFVPADSYKHKRFTNAGAIVATVPKNASQAIPIGARIRITQAGAGQITLTPEDGTVTLNSRGASLKSAGQFAVLEIEKVAANEWDCLGDLTT